MKNLVLLIAVLLFTGCASLTGPQKAEYQNEVCETSYRWDVELNLKIPIHEKCTKSFVKSSRIIDGLDIVKNSKTGDFSLKTNGVKNADESSVVQALSVLIATFATPDNLNAIAKQLQEKK